jgi:uncharacterized Zn finger protein
MFLLHCPACGQRELRSTRAISSFVNTPLGIEIAMGCSRCGSVVRTLIGARAATPSRRSPDAAPNGAGVAA